MRPERHGHGAHRQPGERAATAALRLRTTSSPAPAPGRRRRIGRPAWRVAHGLSIRLETQLSLRGGHCPRATPDGTIETTPRPDATSSVRPLLAPEPFTRCRSLFCGSTGVGSKIPAIRWPTPPRFARPAGSVWSARPRRAERPCKERSHEPHTVRGAAPPGGHRRSPWPWPRHPVRPHAQTPYVPYFGKNQIRYDNFQWMTYETDHFVIYFYPEIQPHLERMAGYAESAYQHISTELKYDLGPEKVALILFQTSSEFQQQNVIPGAAQEGVGAFAEPTRKRILMPMDEPPDLLYRLMVHELTHQFEFEIIPTSLMRRNVPLWVNEGLSDYMTGYWRPLDLMSVRDAAVTDIVPKMSRLDEYGGFSSPRMIYNLGHAVFEFMESKWGKEGLRQYLFALRKSVIGGGDNAYQEAFKIDPEDFDQQFEKYLKDRFKPFRDKERPSDYGRNLAPNPEKSSFSNALSAEPSPSGDLIAVVTGNRKDQEADIVLVSGKDGSVIRNLTKGFDQSNGYEFLITPGGRWNTVPWMSWAPEGDRLGYFVRTEKSRTLILQNVVTRKIEDTLRHAHARRAGVAGHLARRPARGVRGARGRRRRHLHARSADARGHQPDQGRLRRRRPHLVARRQVHRLRGAHQRQREAVPSRHRHRPEDADHLRHPRRLGGAVRGPGHAHLLVHGHQPVAADRPGRGAQRRHLQHLDAEPEERRAAPVHRRDERQHHADRPAPRQRAAADGVHRLLQGRLRAARARPPRSDHHRRLVRLRRARTGDRLPGAAVAQPASPTRSARRASSRRCSSTAARR